MAAKALAARLRRRQARLFALVRRLNAADVAVPADAVLEHHLGDGGHHHHPVAVAAPCPAQPSSRSHAYAAGFGLSRDDVEFALSVLREEDECPAAMIRTLAYEVLRHAPAHRADAWDEVAAAVSRDLSTADHPDHAVAALHALEALPERALLAVAANPDCEGRMTGVLESHYPEVRRTAVRCVSGAWLRVWTALAAGRLRATAFDERNDETEGAVRQQVCDRAVFVWKSVLALSTSDDDDAVVAAAFEAMATLFESSWCRADPTAAGFFDRRRGGRAHGRRRARRRRPRRRRREQAATLDLTARGFKAVGGRVYSLVARLRSLAGQGLARALPGMAAFFRYAIASGTSIRIEGSSRDAHPGELARSFAETVLLPLVASPDPELQTAATSAVRDLADAPGEWWRAGSSGGAGGADTQLAAAWSTFLVRGLLPQVPSLRASGGLDHVCSMLCESLPLLPLATRLEATVCAARAAAGVVGQASRTMLVRAVSESLVLGWGVDGEHEKEAVEGEDEKEEEAGGAAEAEPAGEATEYAVATPRVRRAHLRNLSVLESFFRAPWVRDLLEGTVRLPGFRDELVATLLTILVEQAGFEIEAAAAAAARSPSAAPVDLDSPGWREWRDVAHVLLRACAASLSWPDLLPGADASAAMAYLRAATLLCNHQQQRRARADAAKHALDSQSSASGATKSGSDSKDDGVIDELMMFGDDDDDDDDDANDSAKVDQVRLSRLLDELFEWRMPSVRSPRVRLQLVRLLCHAWRCHEGDLGDAETLVAHMRDLLFGHVSTRLAVHGATDYSLASVLVDGYSGAEIHLGGKSSTSSAASSSGFSSPVGGRSPMSTGSDARDHHHVHLVRMGTGDSDRPQQMLKTGASDSAVSSYSLTSSSAFASSSSSSASSAYAGGRAVGQAFVPPVPLVASESTSRAYSLLELARALVPAAVIFAKRNPVARACVLSLLARLKRHRTGTEGGGGAGERGRGGNDRPGAAAGGAGGRGDVFLRTLAGRARSFILDASIPAPVGDAATMAFGDLLCEEGLVTPGASPPRAYLDSLAGETGSVGGGGGRRSATPRPFRLLTGASDPVAVQVRHRLVRPDPASVRSCLLRVDMRIINLTAFALSGPLTLRVALSGPVAAADGSGQVGTTFDGVDLAAGASLEWGCALTIVGGAATTDVTLRPRIVVSEEPGEQFRANGDADAAADEDDWEIPGGEEEGEAEEQEEQEDADGRAGSSNGGTPLPSVIVLRCSPYRVGMKDFLGPASPAALSLFPTLWSKGSPHRFVVEGVWEGASPDRILEEGFSQEFRRSKTLGAAAAAAADGDGGSTALMGGAIVSESLLSRSVTGEWLCLGVTSYPSEDGVGGGGGVKRRWVMRLEFRSPCRSVVDGLRRRVYGERGARVPGWFGALVLPNGSQRAGSTSRTAVVARGDAAWRVDEYAAAPEAAEDARSALRRWRAARARRENEKSI